MVLLNPSLIDPQTGEQELAPTVGIVLAIITNSSSDVAHQSA